MTIRLPDVNTLVALAWPNHVHHREANDWFVSLGSRAWATCPFTQSGFIRLSSNPRIVDHPARPREALDLLQRLTKVGEHIFWPDDVDFTSNSEIPFSLLVGHRQVTDAYLLGLAIRHGGRLVTLDRSIKDLLPAASPHRDNLEVLGLTRREST